MNLDHPWLLWLLPLALLPLLTQPGVALASAWPALLPRDRASDLLAWALRASSVLALGALVVGMAGPYRPEYTVQRVGTGAEIVLVLDRSSSMDQGYGGARPAGAALKSTGPEVIDFYVEDAVRQVERIPSPWQRARVAAEMLVGDVPVPDDSAAGPRSSARVPLAVRRFSSN